MKYKKSYKSICLFLFLVLLCLCLFGGLKVNASQSDLERYITKTELTLNNNIYLLQIPNNENVILNDDHNYSLIKISFNDNTNRDFLTCKRNGVDSFLLYGYNGVNYHLTILASEFIGIYVYYDYNNDVYRLTTTIMQFNTTTRELENRNVIFADMDIGSNYVGKLMTIYGISYGHFYVGGEKLTQALFVQYTNDFIAPNYSNMFDDVSAQAYASGYNRGYGVGYLEGESTITPFDRFWSILTGIFSSVGAVLSINLFPGVPLGVFILIPLFFGAVGLILWIWRRN